MRRSAAERDWFAGGRTMTTQLNLDPINTALCLAGFAIVWAFLFLRLYGEHRRRTAVWRAFWLPQSQARDA